MEWERRRGRTPLLWRIVGLVLGAWVAGCATAERYVVKVSAEANPSVEAGYAYVLRASGGSQGNGSPGHAEIVERVRQALAQRGMYEAPDPSRAEVVIDFEYGQGTPQTRVTTSTRPEIVQPTVGMSDPLGGTASDPTLGRQSQVVMTQVIEVTQTSKKYVRIEAKVNRPGAGAGKTGASAEKIWIVEGVVDDEKNDLDACIPPIIDALTDFIGTSGESEVKVAVPSGS